MRSATRSGSASGVNSPRSMPVGDRLGEPVAHALVEARRGRAHLGVAHGPQPELHPQDPVALEHARDRAGTGRSSPPAARRCPAPARRPPGRAARRRRARRSTRAPARAGPRGSRSGSGRARWTRPRPSRCGRSAPRRCRRARSARPRRRGCARARRARWPRRAVTRRSARIRSANQAIAASRCDSGPSSKPRVSSPPARSRRGRRPRGPRACSAGCSRAARAACGCPARGWR